MPFGSVPLNSAREVPWGGLGAGGGPRNPNPSRLALELGLNVPLVTVRPCFMGVPVVVEREGQTADAAEPPDPVHQIHVLTARSDQDDVHVRGEGVFEPVELGRSDR